MMSASDDTAAAREGSAEAYRIAISDEQQAMQVDHAWLQQIAGSVLQEEGVETAQISVALVEDPAIHEVNRRYLQHDYPTDVISFLLNDAPAQAGPAAPAGKAASIDGEVVISAETAARTAGELGCPPMHELALYLVHGLLHLCGYDDQTDADRTRMRGREQSHLQKFGITANYEY